MRSPRLLVRFAVALVVATACVALPACGSGSNDATSSAPVAKFTPDVAAPGNLTVALLPSSSNGALVTVRIAVTGVSSFFGSAFRVNYDPNALLFYGRDTSASFLLDGVNSTDVLFIVEATGGSLIITATRLNPGVVAPVDVTTTATLATLTFIARKPLAVGSAEGRLEFGDPKQICDGTVAAPGCGAIAVTWSGGGVSAQ